MSAEILERSMTNSSSAVTLEEPALSSQKAVILASLASDLSSAEILNNSTTNSLSSVIQKISASNLSSAETQENLIVEAIVGKTTTPTTSVVRNLQNLLPVGARSPRTVDIGKTGGFPGDKWVSDHKSDSVVVQLMRDYEGES